MITTLIGIAKPVGQFRNTTRIILVIVVYRASSEQFRVELGFVERADEIDCQFLLVPFHKRLHLPGVFEDFLVA
jgi:hypothetical protein